MSSDEEKEKTGALEMQFKHAVQDLNLSDSSDDDENIDINRDDIKSDIEQPKHDDGYNFIDKNNSKIGTRGYIAPEILLKNAYGTSCDVFSAGVVLFVLLNGYLPFQSATIDDKWYKYIANHEFDQFWSFHNKCNIFYNLQARNLIEKMLEYDANERISVENIKQHDWYKNTPCLKGKQLEQALLFRYQQMREARERDEKKVKLERLRSVDTPLLTNTRTAKVRYTLVIHINSNK